MQSPPDPPPAPPPEAADDEISLLDIALTIAENLRLLILAPLAAGLLALGYSYTIPPTYTANTLIMPPQQQQSAASSILAQLGALGGVGAAAAGVRNPNDQFVALLKSRAVEDRLVERFKLTERYETDGRQGARRQLENNTRVTAGRDGLINIEFDDTHPAFAADVANAYVEELARLLKTLSVTEAQQRRQFFEKLLGEARADLTKAEQALASVRVNPSVLRNSAEATVGPLAQLQAQIRAQEVRLGVMRGYLAENAPAFRLAQDELAALRAQLQKAGQAAPADDGANDYISRFREYKYQETLLDLFTRQYEVARVDESREGAVIQVVDRAVAPERKSKPKKAQMAIVMTLFAGLALLLLVFLRQALRKAGTDGESATKLQVLRQHLRRAIGMRSA